MKCFILSTGLALALAATTWAIDPTPPTVAELDVKIQKLTEQLQTTTAKMDELQERLNTVEKRLGDSYRSTSPFDTVERRLDDLTKDVDDLKRRR